MVHLSNKKFSEFKELYKQEFGEKKFNKKTEEELLESATKLVRLVEILYRPSTHP